MSGEAGSRPVRIDVVINNYNYGRFLGDAIESALAQTHPHVRVVVVDDGSTDDSAQVIAAYGDRVTAVFKENGGQASALNAGFAAATGDVAILLDADDVLDREIAAHVAAAFKGHADLAKIQWRMEMIDAAGRPTGVVDPAYHIPLPNGDMRRAELRFPFDIAWAATTGNALPLDLVRRVLPIPEERYRINADWYLQHLTPLLGPVRTLDLIGARRRVHGGNAFEQAADAELDFGWVRERISCAEKVRADLEALARKLALLEDPGPLIAVSDAAFRLISMKLEPAGHPLGRERIGALVAMGIRASLRRFDISPMMRAAFCAWFVAMSAAPRPLARRLARAFVFPDRRPGLNRLLARLHRREGSSGAQ
jgi:glycosyltransferase involved in cell wall biosynthesis